MQVEGVEVTDAATPASSACWTPRGHPGPSSPQVGLRFSLDPSPESREASRPLPALPSLDPHHAGVGIDRPLPAMPHTADGAKPANLLARLAR